MYVLRYLNLQIWDKQQRWISISNESNDIKLGDLHVNIVEKLAMISQTEDPSFVGIHLQFNSIYLFLKIQSHLTKVHNSVGE